MISLIIPAKNEEHRLEKSLTFLRETFSTIVESEDWEAIVVSDGSVDRTVELVNEAGSTDPRFTAVSLPKSLGKGGAVQAGFGFAKGSIVIVCDADLSGLRSGAARMLDELTEADVVLASRLLPGSEISPPRPLNRRLSASIFRAIVWMFRLDFATDPQCGLKGFRRRGAEVAFGPKLVVTGFAYEIEVLARLNRRGMKVREIPVLWEEAKGSSVRPVRHGIAMVYELWTIKRSLR